MKTITLKEFFDTLESNAQNLANITTNDSLDDQEKELHRAELRVSMFLGTQHQARYVDDYLWELIESIRYLEFHYD